MEFDRWTVLLLRRAEHRPDLSQTEADAVQDAHLAHLSKLHTEGPLVAAGPVDGGRDPTLAGVCIFRVGLEEARRLEADDPAVKRGLLEVETFDWIVPRGTIEFPSVSFPSSMADVNRP